MTAVPDILQKILARKSEEIAERARRTPLAELKERVRDAAPTRGFISAISQRIATGKPAVIAEIKKASPSRGVLRADFDPTEIARSYARHGATCLSVLTDRDFFQGSDDHLRQARAACVLPVLRKDFTIDPYQLYEARYIGADAILLIVAALDDTKLRELNELARELNLDLLIEVHDAIELERALKLNPMLVGINNRDLRTFDIRLETSIELIGRTPKSCIVVTESGIASGEDVNRMLGYGISCFLVGETFMKSKDPGERMSVLFMHQATNN